jgi:hypothetical protein
LTTSNKFCDQCGAQLKATSRYCPSCGTSFDAGGGSTVEERPEQTSSATKTDSTRPCPSCGVSNVRFATSCSGCQLLFTRVGGFGSRNIPRGFEPRGSPPPNYLLAIAFGWLACVLFCWFALPSVFFASVYSFQVKGKWERGHSIEAEALSNKAKIWCWIAIGIIVFVLLLSWYLSWYLSAFLSFFSSRVTATQSRYSVGIARLMVNHGSFTKSCY